MSKMTERSHALILTVSVVIGYLFPCIQINIWFSINVKDTSSIKWISEFIPCGRKEEYWRNVVLTSHFSEESSHLYSILLRCHSILGCFEIFWRFLHEYSFINFTNHGLSSCNVKYLKHIGISSFIKWHCFDLYSSFTTDRWSKFVKKFLPILFLYLFWKFWKSWRLVRCNIF